MRRLAVLGLLLLANCASNPGIVDYLMLPPPERVQVAVKADTLHVSWQPPAISAEATQAGYHVYVSEVSLEYAPMAGLPLPGAVVPIGVNKARVPAVKSEGPLFIHVRSYTDSGFLSLPSLPEVRIDLVTTNK